MAVSCSEDNQALSTADRSLSIQRKKLMNLDDCMLDDKSIRGHDEEDVVRLKPRCVLTIEPILLVVQFTQALTGSVCVDLLETVTCLQSLDPVNCTQPLSQGAELLVQPNTAYFNSVISVLQAVLPSALSLFIGPWSDQNGRKPFLLTSLTGFTVSYAVWGALSNVTGLNLNYYLIPPVILAISGGMVAISTCTNCYISDISTSKNRAFRLTVLSSTSLMGSVTGYLIADKVFSLYPSHGYAVVFFTASIACFLTLLYTVFLVRETIPKAQDRDKNLFNPKFVKEILDCVWEKRAGYSRSITILLFMICFFMNYLIQGESSVKFLTLKKTFGWTFDQFNYFSAVCYTFCVVTSCVGIFVLKLVRVPDLWITVLAAAVWCASDVLLSFATTSRHFWIYSLLGSFAALLGPTVSAELSLSVPKQNIGKLFTFEAALASLTPFAAPPVYAAFYTAIYVDHPLYIYLLSAGFDVLLALLAISVIMLKPILMRREGGTKLPGLVQS